MTDEDGTFDFEVPKIIGNRPYKIHLDISSEKGIFKPTSRDAVIGGIFKGDVMSVGTIDMIENG